MNMLPIVAKVVITNAAVAALTYKVYNSFYGARETPLEFGSDFPASASASASASPPPPPPPAAAPAPALASDPDPVRGETPVQNSGLEENGNENPEEENVVNDCENYLRTGTRRNGSNPSPRSKKQVDQGKKKVNQEYPERTGPKICKYYIRPGGCRSRETCRYHHPQEPIGFNFLGLPIRPEEKVCYYYMLNGSCRYGAKCWFHHPDPTAVGGSDSHSGYHDGGSIPLHSSGVPQQAETSSSWSGNLNGTVPYTDVSPSYVHPNMEWNGYPIPVNPLYQQQMPVEEFPERPGQRERPNFKKKFHHPRNRVPKSVHNHMRLPLRPGKFICTQYSQCGICNIGSACIYDHPPNYSHPASSGASSSVLPPFFDNSATWD